MRKRIFIIQITAAALLLLFTSGCGNKETSETGKGSSSRFYTIADPTGDWGFPAPFSHYRRGPGYIRMSLIFETLTWKDEKSVIPALASSWSYNAREKSYTFNLKKNVKWHDSHPFTAEDVKFTYDYIKIHPYPWVDSSLIKKTEIINSHCIKIYLAKPYSPFIKNIAGTMPIIPGHIYSNVKSPEHFCSPDAATGTGPYILLSYDRASGLYRYRANADYHNGKPLFDEIRFVKISSEMAGNAVISGRADAAAVPPEITEHLKSDTIKMLKNGSDWVAKLMINHRKKLLSDRKMRQAILYAIDRKELVKRVLRSNGITASPGLLPQSHEFYNKNITDYPRDIGKSKKLISSLGFTLVNGIFHRDGKPLFLEILAKGGTSSLYGAASVRTAEMIRKSLLEAGIKTEVRIMEPVTTDTRIQNWQFDLALSGHGGMGADPQLLKRAVSAKGFNSSRFSNPELNRLFRLQESEMNIKKRMHLIYSIQKKYSEELPSIPLYYPDSFWIYNTKAELFSTYQGVGLGVPVPLNRIAFVKQERRK